MYLKSIIITSNTQAWSIYVYTADTINCVNYRFSQDQASPPTKVQSN